MKRSIFFIVFLSVFILFQMLIFWNTWLLMSDFDEVIWNAKQHLSSPQYVQILTETEKEYGEYKNAHDSSVYYMLGAFILLILYIIPFTKKKLEPLVEP